MHLHTPKCAGSVFDIGLICRTPTEHFPHAMRASCIAALRPPRICSAACVMHRKFQGITSQSLRFFLFRGILAPLLAEHDARDSARSDPDNMLIILYHSYHLSPNCVPIELQSQYDIGLWEQIRMHVITFTCTYVAVSETLPGPIVAAALAARPL